MSKLVPRTIRGQVYADTNNNGAREPHELGIPDVPVHLSGIGRGDVAVTQTVMTDDDGRFAFTGHLPGIYSIGADQPIVFLDGIDTVGNVQPEVIENDFFGRLDLINHFTSRSNLFGERGLQPQYVSKAAYLASSAVGQDYITLLQEHVAPHWTVARAMPAPVAPPPSRPSGGSGEFTSLASLSSLSTSIYNNDSRDVNGDGQLTPIDVLLVINYLNGVGAHESTLDVTGDGQVSPIDALLVINSLNSEAVAEGEAMAEINGWSQEGRRGAFFGPQPHPTTNIFQETQLVDDLFSGDVDKWLLDGPPCAAGEFDGFSVNPLTDHQFWQTDEETLAEVGTVPRKPGSTNR